MPPHPPLIQSLWAISSLCWCTSYRQQLHWTRTHGSPPLPPFSYALNLAWELVMPFFLSSSSPVELAIITLWLALDIPLVSAILGPLPAAARARWVATVLVAAAAMVAAHTLYVPDPMEAVFWTGYACQAVVCVGGLWRLCMGRGEKLSMWGARAAGSAAAGAVVLVWGVREDCGGFEWVDTRAARTVVVGQMMVDAGWGVLWWCGRRGAAGKVRA